MAALPLSGLSAARRRERDGGQREIVLDTVRFGMDVAEYREQFRHSLAMRPRHEPRAVVNGRKDLRKHHDLSTGRHETHGHNEFFEAHRKVTVIAAWEMVGKVLTSSHRIVRAMKGSKEHGEQVAGEEDEAEDEDEEEVKLWVEVKGLQGKISHLLDEWPMLLLGKSLPDSNDKVDSEGLAITPLKSGTGVSPSFDGLPPIDLFDDLLSKLQHISKSRVFSPQ